MKVALCKLFSVVKLKFIVLLCFSHEIVMSNTTRERIFVGKILVTLYSSLLVQVNFTHDIFQCHNLTVRCFVKNIIRRIDMPTNLRIKIILQTIFFLYKYDKFMFVFIYYLKLIKK